MEFTYTEIDTTSVWTHGGYQFVCDHDDYPLFIKVHDRDIERWVAFFQQFGVDTIINEHLDATPRFRCFRVPCHPGFPMLRATVGGPFGSQPKSVLQQVLIAHL